MLGLEAMTKPRLILTLISITLLSLMLFFFNNNESAEIGDPPLNEEVAELPIVTTARVQRVIDGDTIIVEFGGLEEKVRLLGVDAPEIDWQNKENTECYGVESKEELERISLGDTVSLQRDLLNENRDKYGRLLRYVFLPDGTMANELLIENGFAEHLSYFPISLNDHFATVEQTAKSSNAGLWSVCK